MFNVQADSFRLLGNYSFVSFIEYVADWDFTTLLNGFTIHTHQDNVELSGLSSSLGRRDYVLNRERYGGHEWWNILHYTASRGVGDLDEYGAVVKIVATTRAFSLSPNDNLQYNHLRYPAFEMVW